MPDEGMAQAPGQRTGARQLGWDQAVLGAKLLIEKDLGVPALVLIYSMIDSMAWMARPQDHPDVTGADFIAWVDQYMLPSLRIKCTAGELYAARCAVLHSLSTESRHVREGKARAIYYSWGPADSTKLERFIERKRKNAVALHLDDLIVALTEGSSRFWLAANSDPELCAIIRPRLDQWIESVANPPAGPPAA
jgi:hypothetical protein